MDGNGRWANSRGRSRVWGHIRGTLRVSSIIETSWNQGVKALTLYAFSSENWSRPQSEISVLLKLLKKFLKIERDRIIKNDIRFKIIGDYSVVPDELKFMILDLEKVTSENKGLKLNIAFGYGSRLEIVDAVNKLIQNGEAKISEESLDKELQTSGCGDVDLLIRTGGDQRISNFLLWQSAYAELFFTETKWPDFSTHEFLQILAKFSKTERRFGALSSPSYKHSVIVARHRYASPTWI